MPLSRSRSSSHSSCRTHDVSVDITARSKRVHQSRVDAFDGRLQFRLDHAMQLERGSGGDLEGAVAVRARQLVDFEPLVRHTVELGQLLVGRRNGASAGILQPFCNGSSEEVGVDLNVLVRYWRRLIPILHRHTQGLPNLWLPGVIAGVVAVGVLIVSEPQYFESPRPNTENLRLARSSVLDLRASQNSLPLVGNSPCPDVDVIKITLVSMARSSKEKSSMARSLILRPLAAPLLPIFLARFSALPPSDANAIVNGSPLRFSSILLNASLDFSFIFFSTMLLYDLRLKSSFGLLAASIVSLFSLSRNSLSSFLMKDESSWNWSSSFSRNGLYL
ncbi:hypothetical protein OGATHE_000707 [Ogataea polymorpha]|uniref:Uncharacterized protein n=1 Tax=Ogataea polymorpha TaxID=460523 RepID=A0A9P8PTW3_9ASCO|nr:hypothetical protein OGATHE_000707 [Ogataea polymorpha]